MFELRGRKGVPVGAKASRCFTIKGTSQFRHLYSLKHHIAHQN